MTKRFSRPALEKADLAERAAYVAEVVKAGRSRERKRIEKLLAAHDKASQSPGTPANARRTARLSHSAQNPKVNKLTHSIAISVSSHRRNERVHSAASGNYEVLEVLERGSFGIVFRASMTSFSVWLQ